MAAAGLVAQAKGRRMRLGALIEGLPIQCSSVPPRVRDWVSIRVCDITEDSRTVVPGSLFVARKGLNQDGKKFTAEALRSGAVAILADAPVTPAPGVPVLTTEDVDRATARLAERFYGDPSSAMKLALVTGTNGKTTTSFLIWNILNAASERCGLIGTVMVDDGAGVARASMTTPPAIELSRSLAVMREAGCAAAALEASSHALDQGRVDGLRVSVGVFTNLTGDHLDYHESMEAYASAKARLFEMLDTDATGVVNMDDAHAERMVRGCKARIVRCTACSATGADASVRIIEGDIRGMVLELQGPWGVMTSRVPLIGVYNAMNVLQACVTVHAMGLDDRRLAEGLAHVSAPPGRLERVSREDEPVSVYVDFAHSDDSLRNVLEAVAGAMPAPRHRASPVVTGAGSTASSSSPLLWVVFGCGGDKDRTKRPRMGKVAASIADRVVVTSDNPRSEKPSAIVDEILVGIEARDRDRVIVQIDRERAIRHAIEHATPGDVVVIAGKGHETEQIVSDGHGGLLSVRFDDREVARAILDERRPGKAKARRPRAAGTRTRGAV